MYEVIKDNVVMAYVDQPVFIRLHENGCYVASSEDRRWYSCGRTEACD